MSDALTLSDRDRKDLRQAQTILDLFWEDLDEWRAKDATRLEGAPLDVDTLHGQARDLTNALARIRRRHAKRREARERRRPAPVAKKAPTRVRLTPSRRNHIAQLLVGRTPEQIASITGFPLDDVQFVIDTWKGAGAPPGREKWTRPKWARWKAESAP